MRSRRAILSGGSCDALPTEPPFGFKNEDEDDDEILFILLDPKLAAPYQPLSPAKCVKGFVADFKFGLSPPAMRLQRRAGS